MNKNVIKIEGIFLTASLLLSCLLSSCGSDKPVVIKQKKMDVTVEFLEPFTPDLTKSSPATREEIEKKRIEQFDVFQLPNKGYYYQITNQDAVSILDYDSGTWSFHDIYQVDNVPKNDAFTTRSNPLLNPKTLLHPVPTTKEDKYPMELFENQNKEKVVVTKTKDIYTVSQNGKEVLTCQFLAYISPWILGSNPTREDKSKPWEYTAINTISKETHLLQLPGKLDEVGLLSQGLLLRVTEQSFFNITSWIYNPSKKNLMLIGGSHTEAVSAGDTPYLVFWDWYENIAKVFRYDLWGEVGRIDFGKYQVKDIIPYQGKDKKWNLWMIPTLTYAKFTTNVYWMPLMVSRPVITNMDFHKELYVSQSPVDSTGRLLLFAHDNPTEDSSAGDLNAIYLFSPKSSKGFALPVHWKTMPEKQRLYYDIANFDPTTEDISFNTETVEVIYQPITSKISPLIKIKLDDEKNPNPVVITTKEGLTVLFDVYPNGIDRLKPNITDGKVSVKDSTITWVQRFHYVLTREYKIPLSKLVPKN